MALKLSSKTKQKQEESAPVSNLPASVSPIVSLIDRYGALKDECDAIKIDPRFAELSKLEAELREQLSIHIQCAGVAQNESITVAGTQWTLEADACRKNPRKVSDIHKIREMLGDDTFMNLCKISISDVDKYLAPLQIEQVVTDEGYNPNRPLKVIYTP